MTSQEKDARGVPIGKDERKLPLFTTDVIIYVENLKE